MTTSTVLSTSTVIICLHVGFSLLVCEPTQSSKKYAQFKARWRHSLQMSDWINSLIGSQIIGTFHIYGQTLVFHAVEGSLDKLNLLNNNVFDFLGIWEIIKPNMTIWILKDWKFGWHSRYLPSPWNFFTLLSSLCPTASNLRLTNIIDLGFKITLSTVHTSPSGEDKSVLWTV